MRFLVIRRADKDTEAGVMPTEEMLTAMAKYLDEMVKAGVLVSGDGLKPSSYGSRVKFSGGKPRVIDGPFTETKELIAGFSVIDVASKEEASEWLERAAVREGEVASRPGFETEDFAPVDPTGELREQENRLREQVAGRQ